MVKQTEGPGIRPKITDVPTKDIIGQNSYMSSDEVIDTSYEVQKHRSLLTINFGRYGSFLEVLRNIRRTTYQIDVEMHPGIMLDIPDLPPYGCRNAFFEFVDKLIGKNYKCGELQEILKGEVRVPTSTLIPQLGSTIAVAGGIVAEAVARIRLGYSYPPRALVNKQTFKVKIFK